ncbi:hypothetical protein [Pararhodobacter oceanensis]|uniref:hypothetical protein n=1 Tax=Pararhodobacter oceanensis TaxID=2172121 RepID=UPI001057F7F1|nr:hypothetical protein [Pararhodobacter oceanensis]
MTNPNDAIKKVAQATTRREKATKEKRKRKAAIQIGPIPGVIPFDGLRNPLSRSDKAYKSGMLIRTKANGFMPSVALNDSEAEEAVKIEALLQPNVYDVKCQPYKVKLPGEKTRAKSHCFDVGIRLECGTYKLVYVRGEVSLQSRTTNTEIAEIVRRTPKDAADEIVVISDLSFSRVYRDNNRRIMMCHLMPDADADQAVVELTRHAAKRVRLENIVHESGLPESTAWQAIMRMIGAGRIGTERDAVIDYPSYIWST